jgi:hypothetical protein
MTGARDLEAVRQGVAHQVVVDQRGHHADLGQAKPERQVVEPVRQEHRHHVARREALGQRPVGETVGQRVHLAIGEAGALEADGDSLPPAVDRRLEIVADEP